MKHVITSSLKEILADRPVALLCAAIVAATLIYSAYVAFSIHPSDLQLATRYTSFGETNYYRSTWLYLLSFIGFGLILASVHIGIIAKLYVSAMRPLAVGFAWLTIAMLGLLYVYTYFVLGIAYLS
ncbi:TPA: hypothetical protein DIV49_00010 [Candidatus Saccharibacteria bacterium]|nr:hypothetical protein [Candidatus Saccharibacteria bacterium]HRJ91008.1 hypothetical protein [Candidatus Saccharibacteria bacterium]